jgi:hypothetical protein
MALEVSGGVVLRKFEHSLPGANVFKTNVKPWITTFFLLTFVTNVLCTRKSCCLQTHTLANCPMIWLVLIAFRIQRTRHRVSSSQQYMHDHTGSALAVIIETGTVYSAAIIALIVTYLAGSNIQFIFLDLVGYSSRYALFFSPYPCRHLLSLALRST